jgi:membrane protein
MQVRRSWGVIRKTFSRWLEHDPQRQAASLAFYVMLAMSPLAIFLTMLLSKWTGTESGREQLVELARKVVGPSAALAVQELMARGQPGHGALAGALGIAAAVIGASVLFEDLRLALNTMWDARAGTTGIWPSVKRKLYAMVLVLGSGALLLASMMATATVSVIGSYFSDTLPIPAAALWVVEVALSLGTLTAVFALILRYVPDTRLPWNAVWIGGGVTAALFVIGKILLGLYLGYSALGSPYGAAGSLVVFLVWIYYSAQMLLYGAQFTYVWAEETAPLELRQARQEHRSFPQPVSGGDEK